MKNLERVKALFEKYLNRTASSKELDEMFRLLRNKADFETLYELFEEEWESTDVEFKLDETSWKEMQSRMGDRMMDSSTKPKVVRFFRAYWQMTAAAAVILIVGLFLWGSKYQNIQVYKTGFGETKEIVLNDQSTVILNANSKLVWHTDWPDSKERKMELEGEAFFKVMRYTSKSNSLKSPDINRKLMPFRVITPDLTVNVLGTSFNVVARRQTTDVYLETGEVLLTMKNTQESKIIDESKNEIDLPANLGRDSIYMTPGDRIQYSSKESTLVQYNVDSKQNMMSWTTGHLVFENQPLKTALLELGDIYGKTFEVADSTLLDRPVNLGLPYKDWKTVSGLMTLSLEIEFIETKDQVKVKRK